MSFEDFLFHLSEVAVLVDFAREKKIFFTGFAHCKSALWKTCELYLASHPYFQFWYASFYQKDVSTSPVSGTYHSGRSGLSGESSSSRHASSVSRSFIGCLNS